MVTADILESILKHERCCVEEMHKAAPGNKTEEKEAWTRMLRDRHATAQQFAEMAIAQVLASDVHER